MQCRARHDIMISVMLRITCCIVLAAIFSILVIDGRRESKELDEELEKLSRLVERIKTPPFSISDYRKRKEKYLLSLQAEKEKRDQYMITLWWGG